ncbi:hypothetical protein [Neoactinobaculum massilliense]|uniref:hypothetical protein n=1 Tax=Neoactinobaculum massilliense TaxID=2364794 RepID=UPI000F54057E|nr:hypothetical protein [Neoactinobaculum massilliense]
MTTPSDPYNSMNRRPFDDDDILEPLDEDADRNGALYRESSDDTAAALASNQAAGGDAETSALGADAPALEPEGLDTSEPAPVIPPFSTATDGEPESAAATPQADTPVADYAAPRSDDAARPTTPDFVHSDEPAAESSQEPTSSTATTGESSAEPAANPASQQPNDSAPVKSPDTSESGLEPSASDAATPEASESGTEDTLDEPRTREFSSLGAYTRSFDAIPQQDANSEQDALQQLDALQLDATASNEETIPAPQDATRPGFTPVPETLTQPWADSEDVPEAQAPKGRGWTHTWVLICTILLTPVAWYVLSDATIRLGVVEGNPWDTGTLNLAAIAELVGGLALFAVLLMWTRRSSLGAQVTGWILALGGLAALALPKIFKSWIDALDTAISGYNPLAANLVGHLGVDLSTGRIVILGVVLLFTGLAAHSARRRGMRRQKQAAAFSSFEARQAAE